MLKPFHDFAPVVAEMVGPMPYPALNSAFDALYPSGLRHYWKANFVKELTDDAISGARRARLEGAGDDLDDAHLPDQRRLPPGGARRRPPSPTATPTSRP